MADPIFPVSALQGNGIGDLLDDMVDELNQNEFKEEPENRPINVAIIGKPNVGKSSFKRYF